MQHEKRPQSKQTPQRVTVPPKPTTADERRTKLMAALKVEATTNGLALIRRLQRASGLTDEEFDLALDEATSAGLAVRWQRNFVMVLN